jgi:predicted amidohydrolase
MSTPVRVSLVQLGYADDESVAERTERVIDLVRSVCGGGAKGSDGPEGSAATGGSRTGPAAGPKPPDAVEDVVPHLVVLPELWAPTGFGYQGWDERAESIDGPTATAMSRLARDCRVILHAGSIVERLAEPGAEGKELANTSLVFGPEGESLAVYRKIHRFGFGAGEPRLMEAGEVIVGLTLPSGHHAALSTCYDLRFPELYRAQLDAGSQVFVVPAAWPAPRVETWSLLGRARAVENQCFLIACNTAGTHAGVSMGGRSQVVSPSGHVLAEAGAGEEVLDLVIDLDDVAAAREAFPVLRDRRL